MLNLILALLICCAMTACEPRAGEIEKPVIRGWWVASLGNSESRVVDVCSGGRQALALANNEIQLIAANGDLVSRVPFLEDRRQAMSTKFDANTCTVSIIFPLSVLYVHATPDGQLRQHLKRADTLMPLFHGPTRLWYWSGTDGALHFIELSTLGDILDHSLLHNNPIAKTTTVHKSGTTAWATGDERTPFSLIDTQTDTLQPILPPGTHPLMLTPTANDGECWLLIDAGDHLPHEVLLIQRASIKLRRPVRLAPGPAGVEAKWLTRIIYADSRGWIVSDPAALKMLYVNIVDGGSPIELGVPPGVLALLPKEVEPSFSGDLITERKENGNTFRRIFDSRSLFDGTPAAGQIEPTSEWQMVALLRNKAVDVTSFKLENDVTPVDLLETHVDAPFSSWDLPAYASALNGKCAWFAIGPTFMKAERDGGKVIVASVRGSHDATTLWTDPTCTSAWAVDQTRMLSSLSRDAVRDVVRLQDDVMTIVPLSEDSERAWVNTTKQAFAVGPGARLRGTITIGDEAIYLDRRSPALQSVDGAVPLRIALEVGDGKRSFTGLQARLRITSRYSEHVFATALMSGDNNWSATLPAFICGEDEAILAMTVTSAEGTSIQVQWEHPGFYQPWWKHPTAKTIIALALVVLLLLTAVTFGGRGRVLAWIPAGWFVTANLLVPTALSGSLALNTPLFLAVFIPLVLVTGSVSCFIPRLLRIMLSSVEPLKLFGAPILSCAPIRRRYYKNYVDALEKQIERHSKAARDEKYVSLPAAVKRPDCDSEISKDPASVATAALDSESVVVIGSGGVGKSALLWQTVRQLVNAWRLKPSRPLPVVLHTPNDELAQGVHRSLGRAAITADLTAAQIADGQVVIVLDGFTDQAWERSLVRDAGNSASRLLVSSRPIRELQEDFLLSVDCTKIEPKPLEDAEDSGSLAIFVRRYCDDEDWSTVLDWVRVACKDSRNRYSPLLVRLALLVKQRDDSVAPTDLFERALEALLTNKGADPSLLDNLSKYLVAHWWDKRLLEYRVNTSLADGNEKAMFDAATAAGIFIGTDQPKVLRAFHDSVLSFLVARGLAKSQAWAELYRAAGDLKLRQSPFHMQVENGSEIFDMCLCLFGEISQIRHRLYEDLSARIAQAGAGFSVEDVVRLCRIPGQEVLVKEDRDGSPMKMLEAAALEAQRRDQAHSSTRCLAHLYCRVAETAWVRDERTRNDSAATTTGSRGSTASSNA